MVNDYKVNSLLGNGTVYIVIVPPQSVLFEGNIPYDWGILLILILKYLQEVAYLVCHPFPNGLFLTSFLPNLDQKKKKKAGARGEVGKEGAGKVEQI